MSLKRTIEVRERMYPLESEGRGVSLKRTIKVRGGVCP